MFRKYWPLCTGSSNTKTSLIHVFAAFKFTSASAKPIKMSFKYILEVLGTNIGEFSVTQTDEDGKATIESVKQVNIKLFFFIG